MIDIKEFSKLKDEIELQKREADKASGALEHLKSKLKEEFQCKNIKEAKELLIKLEEEEKSLTKEFEKEYKEFKNEYSGKLEE